MSPYAQSVSTPKSKIPTHITARIFRSLPSNADRLAFAATNSEMYTYSYLAYEWLDIFIGSSLDEKFPGNEASLHKILSVLRQRQDYARCVRGLSVHGDGSARGIMITGVPDDTDEGVASILRLVPRLESFHWNTSTNIFAASTIEQLSLMRRLREIQFVGLWTFPNMEIKFGGSRRTAGVQRAIVQSTAPEDFFFAFLQGNQSLRQLLLIDESTHNWAEGLYNAACSWQNLRTLAVGRELVGYHPSVVQLVACFLVCVLVVHVVIIAVL
ncbi:hypothetical protein K474DRAFT_1662475, partial [Panus rudis PR-1116 ss-1]